MKIQAQSSFEFLLIFMVGISIITPVVLYVMRVQNNYSDSYKIHAAQNVVNKVAEAADSIYLQGEGAKMVLTIYFPEGITETKVDRDNRMISIRLSIASGETEVYQFTKEPVKGELPKISGVRKITVENKGDYVEIY